MICLVNAGTATAATDRSYPGCPQLSENQSTGPCVSRLQGDLNTVNPGYELDPDGNFGSATRIAVLDFQGDRAKHPGVTLGADGLVGSDTADTLARQADVKRQATQSPTGSSTESGSKSNSTSPNTQSSQTPLPCKESDRNESKRIAASGDFVEHKASSGELVATLRYSTGHQCYWALLNGVAKYQVGTVWLERRGKNSGGDPEQLGQQTTHLLTSSTYTAPYKKQDGQEIRACGRSMTPKIPTGSKEGTKDQLPDISEPVCTDWY